MSDDVDVRTVLATAERVQELADEGWAAWAGPGPGRYAGLTTAVTASRRIPHLLRALRPAVPEWDEWWGETVPLHDTADSAWLAQVRAGFGKPPSMPPVWEDHLDAAFSRELARHAPRGAVSSFLNDDLGRSGWKVKLPDGTLESVFFTISAPLGKVYAGMLVAPDGRTIDDVLPAHLDALRALTWSARQRFAPDVRAAG